MYELWMVYDGGKLIVDISQFFMFELNCEVDGEFYIECFYKYPTTEKISLLLGPYTNETDCRGDILKIFEKLVGRKLDAI
jgi:hypothetical protein